MTKIKQRLFLVAVIAVCILLFCVKLTGLAIHAFLGICLVVTTVKHICMKTAKIKHMPKNVRRVDEILLVTVVIMMATGMLMYQLEGIILVKVLHSLSGVVFLVGVIVHVLQHNKMRKAV